MPSVSPGESLSTSDLSWPLPPVRWSDALSLWSGSPHMAIIVDSASSSSRGHPDRSTSSRLWLATARHDGPESRAHSAKLTDRSVPPFFSRSSVTPMSVIFGSSASLSVRNCRAFALCAHARSVRSVSRPQRLRSRYVSRFAALASARQTPSLSAVQPLRSTDVTMSATNWRHSTSAVTELSSGAPTWPPPPSLMACVRPSVRLTQRRIVSSTSACGHRRRSSTSRGTKDQGRKKPSSGKAYSSARQPPWTNRLLSSSPRSTVGESLRNPFNYALVEVGLKI